MPVQILTFCGSLRAASSNLALLEAVKRLAPEGISVRRYQGIADLPHFTPDLDQNDLPPSRTKNLRNQVDGARVSHVEVELLDGCDPAAHQRGRRHHEHGIGAGVR